MPRKYRPPTKRRVARRTTVPYAFEPAPAEDVDSVGTDVEVEEPVVRATSPDRPTRATLVRHLRRDYSYVRAEILRIVAVAGFLIISLVITSILRG